MHHLLLLLLMASLAVPPVLSQNYQTFVKQHTYRGNTLVDCTADLNLILKDLRKRCKPCNTFILGDNNYNTNLNDVKEVCTTGGDRKPNTNLYVSKKDFRVVTCRRDNNKSGPRPPNCAYRKVGKRNIKSKKITVACENDRPVHFQGCSS